MGNWGDRMGAADGAPVRYWVIRAVVVMGLVLVGVPGQAQIVNVLPLVDGKPQGWGTAAKLGGDWRTGNTDLLVVRATVQTTWRRGAHTVLLAGKGEYGLKSSERYLAHTFEHVRYRFMWSAWMGAETFVQHEFDEFRRLNWRALAGAGLRFVLATWDAGQLAVGLAYMPEWERYDRREGVADSGVRVFAHRASGYASLRVQLGDNARWSTTVFAQPAFVNPRDVKVLGETSLRLRLVEHLGWDTGVVVAYDSRPPDQVETLDTKTKTSLVFSF